MKIETVYFKETGEALECFACDAKELLDGGEYSGSPIEGKTPAETTTAAQAEASEDKGYQDFKFAELRVLAKEAGVEGYGKMKKTELVVALTTAAQAEASEPIETPEAADESDSSGTENEES